MTYRVLYFASLRDRVGREEEVVAATAGDVSALYAELRERHGFTMPQEKLRVAVNGEFAGWERALNDGDEVVFIPPVSGG
jgi:molybdopterin synthase sulfur carrier subunit